MRSTAFVSVLLLVILTTGLVLLMTPPAQAGGHGEDEEISETVSTEGKTGVSLFIVNLYNDQRLLYSLLVTAGMALLGMVVGQATEIVLRLVGSRGGR